MRSSALFAVGLVVVACGSSNSDGGGSGGTGGTTTDSGVDSSTGGTAGSGGSAGSAGTAGSAGAAGAPVDAGTDGDAAAAAWHLPQCTTVSGTSAVTFTSDDGATLAPVSGVLTGTVYTRGLVALEVPNVLLAASGSNLLRSEDAGCTWSVVDSLPSSIMTLNRGVGDRAWGFQDNDAALVRIDAGTATQLKEPVPNVIGFGADPKNADRARLGGSDGTLWETTDAGVTWSPVGSKPSTGGNLLAYRFGFDPQDLDHVLFGAATIGAWVTFDGGKLWKKSTGLSTGNANAFEVIVSPIDSNVVWAEGIDMVENLANAKSEGRHIYLSTDGGQSFTKVVDHDPGTVTLTNGVLLAPSPADANVVYFEFGTYFQAYGTDIFKFDAAGKNLTQTHNAYDDVSAIAFSPADAKLLYFGITSEQIN